MQRGMILFFACIALAALAAAQELPVCCCSVNGSSQQAAPLPSPADCSPQYPIVYNLTYEDILNQTFSCTVKCQQFAVVPAPPAPPVIAPIGCGSPGYAPKPNVSAEIAKGLPNAKLKFTFECPIEWINITRCKGQNCTSWQLGPTTEWIDEGLDWNTNYSYAVQAYYPIGGLSNATEIGVNVGDIECLYQFTDSPFCISSHYYFNFESYLKEKGYGIADKAVSAAQFKANFNFSVNWLFNTIARRFNKAFSCDATNRLQLQLECGQGLVCTAGIEPKCINETIPCNGIGNPFGLFFSQQSCEWLDGQRKFCFWDRSATAIDYCWRCHPQLSCYDYKSKETCERNPCGVGKCSWKEIAPELGIGVCIDERFNNCPLCTSQGSPWAPNRAAWNAVFDVCSPEKAAALSTAPYPCFYNPDAKAAASCENASCASIGVASCRAPAAIVLDANNNLSSWSQDPCGIRVCASYAGACFKDSNADAVPDCLPGNVSCELDYFPPKTIAFVQSNPEGVAEWLHLKILDRLVKGGALVDKTSKPGYFTYLCIGNASLCDAREPGWAKTAAARLRIENLKLKIGNVTVANLTEGNNTLRLWSEDPAKNREVVQELNVFACTGCQGPALLNVSITAGQYIAGALWTSQMLPEITLKFTSPATIVSISLRNATAEIPLTTAQSGFAEQWTFTPTLPLNGSFNLSLTAKNQAGLWLNPNASAIPLPIPLHAIPDPTAVTFKPALGEILNASTATLQLNFSNPVQLASIGLVERLFVTPTFIKKIEHNLTENLTTADNRSFALSLSGLVDGRHDVLVSATDFALRPVSASSWFTVSTKAPEIALVQPSWGVAASWIFNITVESSVPAECRYLFNVPLPPPPASNESFTFAAKFNVSGNTTEHKVFNFAKIPSGDLKNYSFVIYCRDAAGRISRQIASLRVDPSPPKILSAFAVPNPITERIFPDQDLFETTLAVELDEPGFCRWSAEPKNFSQMPNNFPDFDIMPKKSLAAPINVTQIANYTYWIACKNEAELASAPVKVNFYVNLTAALSISIPTSKFQSNRTFQLGADTNKRSWCYWGYSPDAVSSPFDGNFTLYHTAWITEPGPGSYAYYISCFTAEGAESARTNWTVFIDETPPIMLWVNDSSDNPADPEISYHKDKLRAAALATDNETNVTLYWYKIAEKWANLTLKNWTASTVLNGSFFWETGLNLTNGTTYIFTFKPTNIVGLNGSETESDGVTVNFGALPEHCKNGALDANETDIDCGGRCEPCGIGKNCKEHADCKSMACSSGLCAEPTCDDSLATPGFESDIDCGLNCTEEGKRCAVGQVCLTDSDCETGFCRNSICDIPTACEDRKLTENSTETDIDCGGSCPGCSAGKSCNSDADCSTGLSCKLGKCQSLADIDADGDGVTNDADTCPGTPADEAALVDEAGCSPSQKFTCGDEINDGFRQKYFEQVLCDGDGAAAADPDKDDLSNAEEFKLSTNPKSPDTDGDHWKDGIEIKKGTDPKNPKSYPVSPVAKVFKTLLLLLLLGAVGVGGYFAYLKLIKPKLKLPPKPPAKPAPPLPPIRPPLPPAIERLRRIVRPAPPPPEKFIPIEALKKVKEIHPEAAKHLEELKAARLPKEKEAELLSHVKKAHPKVFEKLKEIAHREMLKEVKAEEEPHPEVFEKLKALRAGRPIEHKEILEHIAKEHPDVFERLKKLKK